MSVLPLDFAIPASVADWRAIDDAVMGGVSSSRLRHDAGGFAVFEGVVSLARGGGFASVRSPVADFSAPGAAGYRLEARGDGKRYRLALRTDDRFDGVSWQAGFAGPREGWTGILLPLAAFVPMYRGNPVVDAGALDPARVRQVGLLVGERQAGPFALALRNIAPIA